MDIGGSEMATKSKSPAPTKSGGPKVQGKKGGDTNKNGGANRSKGKNNTPAKGANAKPKEKAQTETKEVSAPDEITVGEAIVVRDLAQMMDRSPIDLIKILMQFGIMAPITHTIDHDTAVIIGQELGVTVNWPEVDEAATEDEGEAVDNAGNAVPVKRQKSLLDRIIEAEDEDDLQIRPPVVAVLGHVDHGKTTLLDRIRNAKVVDTEAGGITQRTGAYQVVINGQKISFLDTPGHEAFTAMRARGAQVTDIVVLVVAADDGVMPQTKEAISHAKAAGVQIIVAMNKIDRPNANPDRVLEELANNDLTPESWGGETIVVPVSALQGDGVDDLLESILLVAEIEEFKANPKGTTAGTVVEAELDKYRGVTATMLVQNGTLQRSDTIVVGNTWGRIKAMFDYDGNPIKFASPSTPVTILGLQSMPEAGEVFARVRTDKDARRIIDERVEKSEDAEKSALQPQMTLDDLFARFDEGEKKVLNLIVRADMQGTLEPVKQSLLNLGNEEVSIKILQAATGNVSESDIMLAEASDAVVIGFSVDVDRAAVMRAESSGVEIRNYEIIYKMIEDIQDALTGMLDPIYEDVVIGHAQVLQLFKMSKGFIAGCNVTDGIAKRNALANVIRNGKTIIEATKISTLRRFTEDVNEVRTGFECGILLATGSTQLQESDVIEIYESQRTR